MEWISGLPSVMVEAESADVTKFAMILWEEAPWVTVDVFLRIIRDAQSNGKSNVDAIVSAGLDLMNSDRNVIKLTAFRH